VHADVGDFCAVETVRFAGPGCLILVDCRSWGITQKYSFEVRNVIDMSWCYLCFAAATSSADHHEICVSILQYDWGHGKEYWNHRTV